MLGRVCQRTFVDTYSKLAFAKLHDRKTPITAAELLNDRAVPVFGEKEMRLSRGLTDRGINYCGNPEHPECELYISIEIMDHTRTRTKSPQTNGIVERYQKTMLDEFYRIAFCKNIHAAIREPRKALDALMTQQNEARTHQGRYCFVKTPMPTFLDARAVARDKQIGDQFVVQPEA